MREQKYHIHSSKSGRGCWRLETETKDYVTRKIFICNIYEGHRASTSGGHGVSFGRAKESTSTRTFMYISNVTYSTFRTCPWYQDEASYVRLQKRGETQNPAPHKKWKKCFACSRCSKIVTQTALCFQVVDMVPAYESSTNHERPTHKAVHQTDRAKRDTQGRQKYQLFCVGIARCSLHAAQQHNGKFAYDVTCPYIIDHEHKTAKRRKK